jgi:N utilization substance protein B
VSARHKGRKRALDVLYAADIRELTLEELLEEETQRALAEPAREGSWEFAREILNGVVEHASAIDELIGQTSSWPLERMPAIDRALLRLACAELMVHSDVPEAVIIAEAGELASEYSTDDSRGFIQGVMGTLVGKIRPSSSP